MPEPNNMDVNSYVDRRLRAAITRQNSEQVVMIINDGAASALLDNDEYLALYEQIGELIDGAYRDGYEAGYDDGNEDGYEAGVADAEAECDERVNDEVSAAESAAYDNGYNDGYASGASDD